MRHHALSIEDVASQAFKFTIAFSVGLGLLLLFFYVLRFLYGSPDLLLPVKVLLEGKADREIGIFASELLHDRLEDVKPLLEWSSDTATISMTTATPPKPVREVDFELIAFGVDVPGLLNWIKRYASYRSRIRTLAVLGDGKLRLSAAYDGPKIGTRADGVDAGPPWRVDDAATLDEAVYYLSAKITRHRNAEKDTRYSRVSDEDFIQFLQALRLQRTSDSTENLDQAALARGQARDILEELINRAKPTRFPDAYSRLANIYEEEGRIEETIGVLERSLQVFPDSQTKSRLSKLRLETVAETPVDIRISPRSRIRPLRPGYSIATSTGTAGSLGAFVEDDNGKIYVFLASLGYSQGSAVIQPGPLDGGNLVRDRVATNSRPIQLEGKASIVDLLSLAELDEGIEFDPKIPGIGKIKGVRSVGELSPGRLRMFGRTSGLMEGTLEAVSVDDLLIHLPDGRVSFSGAIITTKMSQPGDSGALVVDSDRYAVGIPNRCIGKRITCSTQAV